jgi:branched-chain amino acid transport system permease protein
MSGPPWRYRRLLAAGGLLVAPLLLQQLGTGPVRIADQALLYVLLALGMNIVVGYAGLLDLGYVAFYAVGAYTFALSASPHLFEQFAGVRAMFPAGLHAPWWLVLPLGAGLAGVLGMLLGAPTLKLRGDYLAVVTLAFGEILRLFVNNLAHPVNLTNGAHGISQIDDLHLFGLDLRRTQGVLGLELAPVTKTKRQAPGFSPGSSVQAGTACHETCMKLQCLDGSREDPQAADQGQARQRAVVDVA